MRCLSKIRLKRISVRLGFSVPLNVFGPDLSIAHYGTIVVNPNCQIGSFCRIHANTNLGVSAGYKEAPRLGNRCYIGPGAILCGERILQAIQHPFYIPTSFVTLTPILMLSLSAIPSRPV